MQFAGILLLLAATLLAAVIAAKKGILLMLWLVVMTVVTASAYMPLTPKNCTRENFLPTQEMHLEDSLQGFGVQWVEGHCQPEYASDQTYPVNNLDPDGRCVKQDIRVVTPVLDGAYNFGLSALSGLSRLGDVVLTTAMTGGSQFSGGSHLYQQAQSIDSYRSPNLQMGYYNATDITNTSQLTESALTAYSVVKAAPALWNGVNNLTSSVTNWFRGTSSAAKGMGTADVEAAIASLERKGVMPLEGQRPIDPGHVVDLAQKMESGSWNPALNMEQPPGYILNNDGSRVIVGGHHRQIAEELVRMRGSSFELEKVIINGGNVPGGSWGQVQRIPGSR